jgi:hypothetical protein
MLANHNVIMNIRSEIMLEVMRPQHTLVMFPERLSNLSLERRVQMASDEHRKHMSSLTEIQVGN